MTERIENMRHRWKALSQDEKNHFLHQMLVALIETGDANFYPAKIAEMSKWNLGEEIAKDVLGKLAWRANAIWFIGAAVAIGLFFTDLHWAIAIICTLAVLLVAGKISVSLTRTNIVSAAIINAEAFDAFWELGLIALKMKASSNLFANPGTGARWQDVVLMELGWDEQLEEIPLSRQSALREMLESAKIAE